MLNRATQIPNGAQPESSGQRLHSWKEIAAYLKASERSVRRWEKTESLPVHRHLHQKRDAVFAYTHELDAWWEGRRPRLEQQRGDLPVAEPQRKRPWVLAASLLAAALLVGLVVWQRFGPGAAPRGRVMLAVLPFQNLTGDPQQEFFCDGVTEEMITQLGGLQPERLGVIARTSAMKFKGTRKDVLKIGRELRVG